MNAYHRSRRYWLSIALAAILSASSAVARQAPTSEPAAVLSASEREAASRVNVETIREVTSALASPDMQGRGAAQPGGDRAAAYLADRFARLKLKGLGDRGSFLQSIKFRISEVLPESSLNVGDESLKLGEDFAVPYGVDSNVKGLLVYVGYGLRNDFNGVDLKHKIVVLIGGPPKNADEAAWNKAESARVIITYLFRSGAAGLLMTVGGSKRQSYTELADYLTRRRVALADDPEGSPPPIAYISDRAAEKLFASSGATYAQAKEKADSGEPASNRLRGSATITVRVKKEKGTASNVAAVLEGSDPVLKEQAVVYSAHYDAYGVGRDGRVYPGAADNALGVAEMLAVAEAWANSAEPPKRSIIFLALTGEESGLLGAEYWVRHPTWKIEKIAADFNFDGIGTEVYGPVKRIVGFGIEHSELGEMLKGVVAATGNSIAPDPMPDEKAFYRSDHYAFVTKGIPALMLLGAPDISTAELVARAKKWLKTDYHQTTDTIKPEWNWDGPRTLAVVGLIVGLRVANQPAMPAWLKSSPFNQSRGTNKTPPPIQ